MSEYINKLQVTEKLKELAELNSACGYELTTLNLRLTANMIERITAADVAPVVHGEWITIDGISRCSECGYIPAYDSAIDDLFYSPFCPNCGAKNGGDTHDT